VRDIAAGCTRAWTLSFAQESGILALLEEPSTAGKAAARLGWSMRGARMLLDALVALGRVALSDGKYLRTEAPEGGSDAGQPGEERDIVRDSLNLLGANRAGVFEQLETPRTAEQLAKRLGWRARGTRKLLEGLVGLEILAESDGRYRNAQIASLCLAPGGPT